MRTFLLLSLLGIAYSQPSSAQSEPGVTFSEEAIAQFEQRGATIGRITVNVGDIFDLSNPEENKRLYRAANQFHIETRESVIRNVLLLRSGDTFSSRLLAESERLLRRRSYIADATISAIRYDAAANTVDIAVNSRDAWSFKPELRLSRSGGENKSAIGIAESNVLGFGKDLKIAWSSNVDRDETLLRYVDSNVRGGRVRLEVVASDNSDGQRHYVSAGRPFYALDSRWAVNSQVLNDTRIDSVYDLGEVVDEFTHDNRYLEISGGLSQGLIDGAARRWLVGAVYDDSVFSPTADVPAPQLLPANRKLVYPWVGVQIVQDDFRRMSDLNTIGRIEDVAFGLEFLLQLGRATEALGADRDAWILNTSARKGWQLASGRMVFFDVGANTRWTDDGIENGTLATSVRYFRRNFDKHLFSVGAQAVLSDRLDADRQVLLGGDTGLRGYPLRYQAGRRSALISVEQRLFTDWYPWRLFRVGAAVFVDAGRTWGKDPRGTPSRGMLYDVGAGVRLASPRSSRGAVVHIDLAFPLNGDPSIDSVQLSVETKGSF
jgi:hypothetical protein